MLLEGKKLLWHQKGLLLIPLLLFLSLLGTVFLTQPFDRELEAQRAVYDRYLLRAEGPMTPEKRAWIEEEMLRLNTVHAQLEQLQRDYYSGNVSEEDFREQFEALSAQDQEYPGFSKLYTQYIFVRASENRQFLYTGGWEVLFGEQDPDYLFLLLLIFLITPVFCQEYGTQMDHLLMTQKRSAGNQWSSKAFLAFSLTAILTLLLELFQLCYCAIRFGLPHWDYSLQSLSSFGSAAKSLTLGQAFFLQLAIKEAGYLLCTALVMFYAVLFRKASFCIMGSIATLILPFLTVRSNEVFLRIPGPWALTLGSIYLNGSRSRTDPQTGEAVTVFQELTGSQLILLLATVAGLLALLLLYIRRKTLNRHLRKSAVLGLACLLALSSLGCGNQKTAVLYNDSQSDWFENESYLIQSIDRTHLLLDKKTGMHYPFSLDAFTGETVSVSGSFYAEGDRLYYVKQTARHERGGYDDFSVREAALVQLELATLEETVIYQWNSDASWFFGLLDRTVQAPIHSPHFRFFLHGQYLYYLENSELRRMHLATGAYEPFLTLPHASAGLAYDGENLYFTDSYSRLVRYDLRTGVQQTLEQVVAKYFLLTEDGIYFLNQQDHSTLYRWDPLKNTLAKLDDTEAYRLYWDPEYLWIDSMEGFFRLDRDGTHRTKVSVPGNLLCMPYTDTFYMEDFSTGKFYQVQKESLAWEETDLTP